eukprot:gene25045-1641_t
MGNTQPKKQPEPAQPEPAPKVHTQPKKQWKFDMYNLGGLALVKSFEVDEESDSNAIYAAAATVSGIDLAYLKLFLYEGACVMIPRDQSTYDLDSDVFGGGKIRFAEDTVPHKE